MSESVTLVDLVNLEKQLNEIGDMSVHEACELRDQALSAVKGVLRRFRQQEGFPYLPLEDNWAKAAVAAWKFGWRVAIVCERLSDKPQGAGAPWINTPEPTEPE